MDQHCAKVQLSGRAVQCSSFSFFKNTAVQQSIVGQFIEDKAGEKDSEWVTIVLPEGIAV